MFKVVYEIDGKGYIIERYVAEFKDGNMITVFEGKAIVEKDLPSPNDLYIPKWENGKWVEGETEEGKAIRLSEEELAKLLPENNALEDAEFEVKVTSLLLKLGVF